MATVGRVRRAQRRVRAAAVVGLLFAALTSTGSAAGAIERVSVVGADLAPIGNSRSHVLSGDGRYVAFVAGSPDALAGGCATSWHNRTARRFRTCGAPSR